MRRSMCLLGPILGLALFVECVSLESAPALVWSSQTRSPELPVRFSTLVDQIEPNDLLSEYAQSKVPIVAFVQKDLSVEQFAANDAPFVAQLFDNLQMNPVLYTNVKSPRRIYASFKTDTSAVNENIVVYLPGKNLKENDDFIKSYTEKFNASGPVIFMLTGENNEYLKTNKRVARQAKADPKPLFGFAPKEEPCFLVYTKGASATLSKKDQDTQLSFDTAALDEASVKCDKTNNFAQSATLKFSSSDPAKKEVLTLELQFLASNLSGWTFGEVVVDISGSYGNFKGSPKSFPTIDTRFSFSCQKTIISLENGTTEYTSGILDIEALQLQPFFNLQNWDKKASPRFTDSSDCAVWFTMPIWTGLIVSLILIAILYSGVVALMSIITPDRFENPKGRGLIITNVEE